MGAGEAASGDRRGRPARNRSGGAGTWPTWPNWPAVSVAVDEHVNDIAHPWHAAVIQQCVAVSESRYSPSCIAIVLPSTAGARATHHRHWQARRGDLSVIGGTEENAGVMELFDVCSPLLVSSCPSVIARTGSGRVVRVVMSHMLVIVSRLVLCCCLPLALAVASGARRA